MRLTKTVRSLLERRPSSVIAVAPNATVLAALGAMAAKHIGAVLVMEGEKLVGIYSERDYARQGEIAGRAARDTPIRDVMTKEVVFVTPDHTIEQCMALMTERRVRHLPVLERDRVVGVLSNRDLVEAVIAEQQLAIRGLETEHLIITSGNY